MPSGEHSIHTTPEQRLAIAKLTVMLECLAGRCRELGAKQEGKKQFIVDEAHRWFFDKSDFEWWCWAAGFEPDYVREKARKVLENGLPASVMQRQGGRLPTMTAEERRLRRNAYHRQYYGRKRG
ncbi:hypothetical protein [Fimbriiglobus ruber]|uniref:hypothetical protein n=1 Tax=Fimbriiglobus ruber TaxID=1908690 RepID=UPI000B4B774F|nr:hypothetical protein [Fimbriiglobus ruber]